MSGGLTDEQTIVFDSSWENFGGSFKLQFGPTPSNPNVYTTPSINYTAGNPSANAAATMLALNSLGNIGGEFANVDVSAVLANGGETFTITFAGSLADVADLPTLVCVNPSNDARSDHPRAIWCVADEDL